MKHAHLANVPHVVYRCFSATGVLLYIGFSANMEKRLALHRSNRVNSYWFPHVDHIETTEYPTRAEAEIAERDAIRTERPACNVQHNRNRHAA